MLSSVGHRITPREDAEYRQHVALAALRDLLEIDPRHIDRDVVADLLGVAMNIRERAWRADTIRMEGTPRD